EYSRSRAPNLTVAEVHGVQGECEPVPVAALALLALGCHPESDVDYEHILRLAVVHPKREAFAHMREHRHDAMAERGHVKVEIADWIHKAARKRDLFLGFTKCCRYWARVASIDLAARKRNLPAMCGETRCALGKQDARLISLNHRHEHRRGPDRPHRRDGGEQGRI